MLQVRNSTPLKAAVMLLPDLTGVDTLVALVKGTFRTHPRPSLADEQLPIVLGDQHYGEPATSSVRAPSDAVLMKPGTDVLLMGSAYSPDDRPVWQMDVSLAVGPIQKTIRVSGDRVWQAGAAGASMTWLAPFTRMPLVWERAYGGTDVTDRGPAIEPRNPAGVGFRAGGGVKPLDGLPVPNIEDPQSPITSPSDRPAPAGFAPIPAHWLPRRAYAGTYDETWERTRAPYLPQDFDARFFQTSPAGLATTGYLTGDELVDVRGATPGGALQFRLPSLRVAAVYRIGTRRTHVPAVLDTVILEPEAEHVVLVWRAALTCDKHALRVSDVEISVDGLA